MEHVPVALGYAALLLAIIVSGIASLYALRRSPEERAERRGLPRWRRFAEGTLGVAMGVAFVLLIGRVF